LKPLEREKRICSCASLDTSDLMMSSILARNREDHVICKAVCGVFSSLSRLQKLAPYIFRKVPFSELSILSALKNKLTTTKSIYIYLSPPKTP